MKRMRLKIISTATAIALLCAGFAFADEDPEDAPEAANGEITAPAAVGGIPADVSSSPYEQAIVALIDAGAITGDEDGLFHPTDLLTRAQACVIVVKTIDPPDANLFGTATQSPASGAFSDLRGYGWAQPYINYAARHDIVNGYPDGTFRPGNQVTGNEMLTMVLRAAGYTDDVVGTNWPADHIAKAAEVGILDGIEQVPALATKEIAAQMTYNQLDALQAIGAAEAPFGTEEPGGAEGPDAAEEPGGAIGTADAPEWAEGLIYATGRFNANMTTYAGRTVSPQVEVFTYGVRADYKSDMILPAREGQLSRDTIHKFKNAETPAFYRVERDRIVYMILPTDAGFSGRVHGVVNEIVNAINGKHDPVRELRTLAAGQRIAWLTKDEATGNPTDVLFDQRLDGMVYELATSNGIVQNIYTSRESRSHKDFDELTNNGGISRGWNDKVIEFSDGAVRIEDGNGGTLIAVDSRVVIYMLSDDGKSYTVGRQRDIREGDYIRAFSFSSDGDVANIITLKRP